MWSQNRAKEDLVNLDSARQSQIEAVRSDRRRPAPSGQGEEENRFGKVAASPNSPKLTERGVGPVLLFGSFAALSVKCAPDVWPIAIAAFLGYAVVAIWKKWGLVLALSALIAVAVFWPSLWMALLATSVACSWLLILLKDTETADAAKVEKEAIEVKHTLQLRETHASFVAEKQRLRVMVDRSDEELKRANERIEALVHDLEQKSAPVPVIQAEPEVPMEHKYRALEQQFHEKSQQLDIARKDLFRVENELLSLQKEWEEQNYEISAEDLHLVEDLNRAEQECRELENQVALLQDFITTLLSPKKRATRKAKAVQEDLPLLLQEKIDQIR